MTDTAAVISGLGVCLPEHRVTNHDLAQFLDTSDDWVRTRTGIGQRYWVAPGTSTGDLATAAGRAAMKSAALERADLLMVTTATPDRHLPATAPEVAARLGFDGIPAFDLAAVCAGFAYGVATAAAFIQAGLYQHVLLIGADTYSTIIDKERDRTTAVVFGDGAGAAVLRRGRREEPGAILATDLGSDGRFSHLAIIEAGGSRVPDIPEDAPRHQRFLTLRGGEIYAHAVRRMTASTLAVVAAQGWQCADVEALVPHQANARITEAVARRLGLRAQRCIENIQDVGNTSAASIPIALAHACTTARVRPGAPSVLTGFGGGLAWGAAAFAWPDVTPVTAACESPPPV